MQHLDEGTIHAWLDGALPADEAADVERHARECAECAVLVADARGMIAGAARIVSALDDVPSGVIPKRPAPAAGRSLWRTLHLTPLRAALAASLMVAAASLTVVRYAPRDEVTPASRSEPTARQAVADAAPVAAPVPATDMSARPRVAPVSEKVAEARRSSRSDSIARAPAAAAPRPLESARPTNSVAVEAPKVTVAVDSAAFRDRATAQTMDTTRSAKSSSVAARREAEQVAVTATAPPSGVRAMIAGAAGRSAAGVGRDVALLRETAGTPPPFSLVLTSADDRPLALPGCYQLVPDSLRSALQLPDRLSLEISTESGVRRNIVRALAQDGRRDSVVAGVSWQPTPVATRVAFTRGEAQTRLSLSQAAPSPMGRGALGFSSSPIRLVRIDCR